MSKLSLIALEHFQGNSERTRSRVDVIILSQCKTQILCYFPVNDGLPETPGGGIDPGENTIQAAIRETMEESGHTLKDIQVLSENEYRYSSKENLNCWLNKNNVDYQIENFVVAISTGFNPDKHYAKEGDVKPFKFLPLVDFVSQTKIRLSNAQNPHWTYQCVVRNWLIEKYLL